MKRVIKSIAASTLPEGVRYLMGDPDDEYALEGYGDGYKVATFDEIMDDMVSDIRTDDIIIRIINKKSGETWYSFASKSGQPFDSFDVAMDNVLNGLAIKEMPEYDATTKTIYTTYGADWADVVDCAELPEGVYEDWLNQVAVLYDSDIQDFLDTGIDSKEASAEILQSMVENYNDYYGDSLNKLSPRPEELF